MSPSKVSMEIEQQEQNKKPPQISGKSLPLPRCVSNCQDTSLFHIPQKALPSSSFEVDILEIGSTTKLEVEETDDGDDDPNATEYSSSFSGTASGPDDTDAEAESSFCLNNANALDSNLFDGYDSMFERKKKTAHWRSYIQPLMWRCKWMEIRIKELQSQALKYDRQLASYDQRKQLELGTCASEGYSMRSLPFCGRSYRKKVMKRRNRKRKENEVDIPSYMARHNLFSYYENKRSEADGASVDDDCGVQVFAADLNNNDDLDIKYAWPLQNYRDDGNSLGNILCQIENVQCRVKKLRTQLDEILTVNAGKFSSMESLLVQSDMPSSSGRSHTLSTRDGDAMPLGTLYTPPHNISECDIGDLVMPEGLVSSDGEAAPFDIIKGTTTGLLHSVDVHLGQPQNGDICKNIVDEAVVHNQRHEEESTDVQKVSGLPTEKPQKDIKEEVKDIAVLPSIPALKPEPDQDVNIAKEQSGLKSCLASDLLVPKNKRNPKRKAATGGWKASKIFTPNPVGESGN